VGPDTESVSDESGIDWEEIEDSAVEVDIETSDNIPTDGITTADKKNTATRDEIAKDGEVPATREETAAAEDVATGEGEED